MAISLTPLDIEEQEHLSADKLSMILEEFPYEGENAERVLAARPDSNFIDIMNWVQDNFALTLKDNNELENFVHNKISIDGEFLQFCQENNVKVTCLFKDAIISWASENGFEKFFAQGIFKIETKDTEFLHSALYHKGNQNEDEICFFVTVSNSNYEDYLKLRNSYDDWLKARDRSNLHIRVVDGEDIPYVKENTWGDMFLPEDIKSDIKNLVENFLNSQDFYIEKNIPWKRGIFLYGAPGCGKSSIIRTIISEYNFKPITVAAGASNEAVNEAFRYAEEQSPSLLFFEDLDSLFESGIDISNFLNLMDGIATKNGLLVIATTNEIKKFKSNIIDRPSRFDRKFDIPLPSQEMAYTYLKKWFGSSLTAKKGKELAKHAESYKFSYAYLKELYISSMFEALSNNRNAPSEKDIQNALNNLKKDKNILGQKTISTDRYLKQG